MPEEEKDAQTLDEAFDTENTRTDTGTEKTSVEQESKKVETDETKLAEPESSSVDEKPGEVELETPEKTGAQVQKTWKDFGLSRYDDMSNEQIAQDVNFRNRLYGSQANELGRIKRENAELLKRTQGTEAAAGVKPEEKGAKKLELPQMTEGELIDFQTQFETNPVGAIMSYLQPHMQKIIAEQTGTGGLSNEDQLANIVATVVDIMSYKNFAQGHSDYEAYDSNMRLLDSPENLGEQQRPYQDLYELSKLGMSQDPLYESVYSLMAQHSTINFESAKEMATLRSNSKGTNISARDDVRKTVAKIDSTASVSSVKTSAPANKKFGSVDEAFDSVNDND